MSKNLKIIIVLFVLLFYQLYRFIYQLNQTELLDDKIISMNVISKEFYTAIEKDIQEILKVDPLIVNYQINNTDLLLKITASAKNLHDFNYILNYFYNQKKIRVKDIKLMCDDRVSSILIDILKL